MKRLAERCARGVGKDEFHLTSVGMLRPILTLFVQFQRREMTNLTLGILLSLLLGLVSCKHQEALLLESILKPLQIGTGRDYIFIR